MSDYSKAMKKINDPKLTHNQLFLVGVLKQAKMRKSGLSMPIGEKEGSAIGGKAVHTHKGNEVVICKASVKGKLTLSDSEVDKLDAKYSSIRFIAGTSAGKLHRLDEKPIKGIHVATL